MSASNLDLLATLFRGFCDIVQSPPLRSRCGSSRHRLDKVESNCGACHSLDYIPMNSPFLNTAGWDAEVAKMSNAFGAPIDHADAKALADYLQKNYGI